MAITRDKERAFWRAVVREGASTAAAAKAARLNDSTARRWFRECGGVAPLDLDELAGRYLSLSEREEIAVGLAAGLTYREIARRIGRAPSTISREIRLNGPDRPGRPYRAVAAQRAARSTPSLRVGIVDASYDSMPLILHAIQQRFPDLEIHQVEAGVPEQFQRLMDGRLDIGLGRASLAPPTVASELFRLDPLGVLVAEEHRFAALSAVPVASLAAEPLLLAEEERAPEFNQFVIELCRSVGFAPTPYRGTVESIRASLDLVVGQQCVLCAPSSCVSPPGGIVWKPLVAPPSRYPWSVLWRVGDSSQHVRALVRCARTLSQQLGWLEPQGQVVSSA